MFHHGNEDKCFRYIRHLRCDPARRPVHEDFTKKEKEKIDFSQDIFMVIYLNENIWSKFFSQHTNIRFI